MRHAACHVGMAFMQACRERAPRLGPSLVMFRFCYLTLYDRSPTGTSCLHSATIKFPVGFVLVPEACLEFSAYCVTSLPRKSYLEYSTSSRSVLTAQGPCDVMDVIFVASARRDEGNRSRPERKRSSWVEGSTMMIWYTVDGRQEINKFIALSSPHTPYRRSPPP